MVPRDATIYYLKWSSLQQKMRDASEKCGMPPEG